MKHNLNLIHVKYSEKELEDNIHLFDKFDWMDISFYQTLSEVFIEKYLHKLSIYYICSRQDLSEKFIAKHANKITWDSICKYQNLSEKFIQKHIDKINIHINLLMKNNRISLKLKNKIKKEIILLKEII